MDSAERQSCPSCGETVPLATTACPFCQESLLVDVVLAAPVEDERMRYQLARAIASLGPPAPDFATVKRALKSPRPVLARGMPRLAARHLLESLTDFGIAGTAEAAGTTESPSSSGARRLAIAAATLAVAAVAGILLLATRRGASSDHAIAAPTSPLPQERSIPWTTPSPPLALKDLSALALPATVEVHCGDRRSAGFFVTRDELLTRAQATEGCSVVEVAAAGRETLQGQVTARDLRLGVTLIRVTGSGAEPLRLGDATSLHSGDRVVLLGAPAAGGANARDARDARMGIAARQFHGIAHLPLEGDVEPGDAGAAVLDGQGYVVGVVTAPNGKPFLLPINYTYDESHLLERPSPGPNLRRWRALLAEVELAEKLRVEPSPGSGTTPAQAPGDVGPPPKLPPSIQ